MLNKPAIVLPDRDDDAQRDLDEWLEEYARLVIDIEREHREEQQASAVPSLTIPAVLARSDDPATAEANQHEK